MDIFKLNALKTNKYDDISFSANKIPCSATIINTGDTYQINICQLLDFIKNTKN